MSYKEAANCIDRSRAFIQKWVTRFKTAKNVDDLTERGKTRATSREDKVVIKLFEADSPKILRQAQKELLKKS